MLSVTKLFTVIAAMAGVVAAAPAENNVKLEARQCPGGNYNACMAGCTGLISSIEYQQCYNTKLQICSRC
ncbi:hypothetical protein F66182_2605 [Fusarium sp. NRRL 66182]|nr:hypothetical protein F66182_2605 [Fusarium sp. NRRL 66182]